MITIHELHRPSPNILRDINCLISQLSSSAKPLSPQSFKDMLQACDIHLVGAEDGKKVIGMGTLVVMRTTVGVRARIEDVVVDEHYRGQGLGEKLSKKLIQIARREKVKAIELSSRPSRIAANKLYQKLGFEQKETNVYILKF